MSVIRIAVLLVSLLCLCSLSALIAQTPTETVARQQFEISGSVLDRKSGAAVEGAVVQVTGTARAGFHVETETDAKGRYALPGLSVGDYLVVALKDGVSGGRHVTVRSASLDLHNVDFRLPRPSVIAGHISEADGTPAVDVTVTLRRRVSLGRLASYEQHGETKTDEHGDYRLQAVSAGQFYIAAGRSKPTIRRARVRTAEAQVNQPLRDVVTYYPGTSAVDGMTGFTAVPGEDVYGMDLKLIRTATYCARASVLTSSPVGVTLFEEVSGGGRLYITNGPAQSRWFEVCGLAPGSYYLTAQIMPSDFSPATNFGDSGFVIGHEDVDIGEIRPQPAITQKGRVSVIDEKTAKIPEGMMIEIQPVGLERYAREEMIGPVSENGEFSLARLFPRPFTLEMRNVPKGYYVKYVRMRGRDALTEPFRVGEGDLEIGLAKDAGAIAGTVVDGDGKPVPECTIVLTPEVIDAGALRSLLRVAYSDQDGRFNLDSVPPGKHFLYAVSGMPLGDEQDPNFLRGNSRRAQELTTQPNGTDSVKLTVLDITN